MHTCSAFFFSLEEGGRMKWIRRKSWILPMKATLKRFLIFCRSIEYTLFSPIYHDGGGGCFRVCKANERMNKSWKEFNFLEICSCSHFLIFSSSFSLVQVSTSTGVISHFVNLQVVVPEAFILGSGELHVDMGSAINLVCIIEKVRTTSTQDSLRILPFFWEDTTDMRLSFLTLVCKSHYFFLVYVYIYLVYECILHSLLSALDEVKLLSLVVDCRLAGEHFANHLYDLDAPLRVCFSFTCNISWLRGEDEGCSRDWKITWKESFITFSFSLPSNM